MQLTKGKYKPLKCLCVSICLKIRKKTTAFSSFVYTSVKINVIFRWFTEDNFRTSKNSQQIHYFPCLEKMLHSYFSSRVKLNLRLVGVWALGTPR